MDRTVNIWYKNTARQRVSGPLSRLTKAAIGVLNMAEDQLSQVPQVHQCKSCERKKPADDFYASNIYRCKECVKERVRRNRKEKADYYQAYDRKRYREQPHRKEAAKRSATSDAGLKARARSVERAKREDPQKFKARHAVSNAIRDGRLARGTECYFCGCSDRLQAHHEDYDHPLDVVWLCASCHGKLHTIKGDFRRANKEARV